MKSLLLSLLATVVLASSVKVEFKHHDNKELNEVLQRVNKVCPNITRLYELSERSVAGWPLTVIEISDQPGQHELRKKNIILLNDLDHHCLCLLLSL